MEARQAPRSSAEGRPGRVGHVVCVRDMREHDVDRVAALEAASFGSPWQADTFRRLLGRAGAELMVVQIEEEVIAYAVLWCILDQGELANIAVEESWRGRGIGGRLMGHVLDRARERGVKDLFLEVRESNAVARELYARRGFQAIGVRRDYYDSPREDACVLRLGL